ncbi:MAG: type II toxin-antitoxin system HicA family toxin [Ktedonobacterales bacterium]
MPRKLRQLRSDLRRAGFQMQPSRGKGSHTWWVHPQLPGFAVNLSGQDGADARPYQEDVVKDALKKVKEV